MTLDNSNRDMALKLVYGITNSSYQKFVLSKVYGITNSSYHCSSYRAQKE